MTCKDCLAPIARTSSAGRPPERCAKCKADAARVASMLSQRRRRGPTAGRGNGLTAGYVGPAPNPPPADLREQKIAEHQARIARLERALGPEANS